MKEKLQNVLLALCSVFMVVLIIFTVFGIKKLTAKKDNTVKYMGWCRSYIESHRYDASSEKKWMVACVKDYRKIEKKLK